MEQQQQQLTPEQQQLQQLFTERQRGSLLQQIANQAQKIADLEANTAILVHQIEALNEAAKGQAQTSAQDSEPKLVGEDPIKEEDSDPTH